MRVLNSKGLETAGLIMPVFSLISDSSRIVDNNSFMLS